MGKTNRDKVLAKRAEEKRKQAEMESRGYKVVSYFKPSVGENQVRMMPPWTEDGANAGQFWREVYRHWNVGEGGYDEEHGWSFTCPVKTPDGPGGECEVCDFEKELRASDSPVDREIAKNIRAKRRIYSNVVDLEDPEWSKKDVISWKKDNEGSDKECPFEPGDTKIQVWSYGQTVFKVLLDFAAGADIDDLDAGLDITVTREGKGINTEYRLVPDLTGPSSFDVEGDFSELVSNLDLVSPFPGEGMMAKCLAGEHIKKDKEISAAPSNAPGLPPATQDEEEAPRRKARRKPRNTSSAVDDVEAELRSELE